MTFLLGVAETAVAASMCSRLVQVDVDFRMTQVLVTTIAPDHSFGTLDWRNFINEFDAPVFVDVTLGVCETDISVILLVENLSSVGFCGEVATFGSANGRGV